MPQHEGTGSGPPTMRHDEIEDRSRWVGTLAHELRTPLTSMRLIAEYLLNEDLSDVDRDPIFLKGLHDQIINMSNMLENLLELGRLDHVPDAAEVSWSRFRLRDIAENAADTVRPLIDHAKVTLAIEVTPDDLGMNGDSVSVTRLITNLMRNAQKHTGEGAVHLAICAVPQCDEPMVAIVVCDTGEGIPAHLKGKLGVPHVTGESSNDWRRGRGAGLGLSICNRIVAAHGGTMFIASSPGQGTQVTVHLRADLSEPVASP